MRNPIWIEICSEDRRLYKAICAIFTQLPDAIDLGADRNGDPIVLSSHMLARGFANAFPQAKCIDGCFSAGFQHSWLVTETSALIDVYPVAMVGGPLLFLNDPVCHVRPSNFLYHTDIDVVKSVYAHIGKEQFDRAVKVVTQYIYHIQSYT